MHVKSGKFKWIVLRVWSLIVFSSKFVTFCMYILRFIASHGIYYSEDTRTVNSWYLFGQFFQWLQNAGSSFWQGYLMLFTLTKWYTCNTMHHKKNLHFLVVESKMYRKMSDVHGSGVLTVSCQILLSFHLKIMTWSHRNVV